ncbi:MAG: DUF465 domain-containing protein [Betaproteobacteria bacterium]|nr:DUF465 domain-containing protein [Betaproteobacteria bacterium]
MPYPTAPEEIRQMLHELESQHHDIGLVLDHFEAGTRPDELLFRRLKKRKLYIKDRIVYLESLLTPDVPA